MIIELKSMHNLFKCRSNMKYFTNRIKSKEEKIKRIGRLLPFLFLLQNLQFNSLSHRYSEYHNIELWTTLNTLYLFCIVSQ